MRKCAAHLRIICVIIRFLSIKIAKAATPCAINLYICPKILKQKKIMGHIEEVAARLKGLREPRAECCRRVRRMWHRRRKIHRLRAWHHRHSRKHGKTHSRSLRRRNHGTALRRGAEDEQLLHHAQRQRRDSGTPRLV